MMPWALLVFGFVVVAWNAFDEGFCTDRSGPALYFVRRILTPGLLFVLAAVTWIWSNQ